MRHALIVLLLAWAPAGLAPVAMAAPEARPWPHFEAHDPDSRQTIDHGAWAGLLQRHLIRSGDAITRVDYGAFSRDERAALDAYVQSLAAVAISRYRRAEQLAYWINLYNALTVQVILDHHPVASIRDIDISPGLFSNGPWGKELVEVEGKGLSLDDIEHRILRPIWRDPRIHYAVNCASVGCPDLQSEPFRGATIEAQLDNAARTFVNHPRGVRIEGDELVVSRIYDWFMADFGGAEAAVIAHLRSHAEPELARALGEHSTIDDFRYDWSLNDAGGG